MPVQSPGLVKKKNCFLQIVTMCLLVNLLFTSSLRNYNTFFKHMFVPKYKTRYKFLDVFIVCFINASLINTINLS